MPIDRGCFYSKSIQVKDRSTGQPMDISAWQFAADLLDASGNTLLGMSTGAGHFTVFDGPNGWFRFNLTPTETGAMQAGPVSFVLKRTDDVNGAIRFATGAELVRDEG